MKEQKKIASNYIGLSAWQVSEIETSPVSELIMVLMKIDLCQADNSRFLGVNHPWRRLGASYQKKDGCIISKEGWVHVTVLILLLVWQRFLENLSYEMKAILLLVVAGPIFLLIWQRLRSIYGPFSVTQHILLTWCELKQATLWDIYHFTIYYNETNMSQVSLTAIYSHSIPGLTFLLLQWEITTFHILGSFGTPVRSLARPIMPEILLSACLRFFSYRKPGLLWTWGLLWMDFAKMFSMH